jgi:hypothetical protein
VPQGNPSLHVFPGQLFVFQEVTAPNQAGKSTAKQLSQFEAIQVFGVNTAEQSIGNSAKQA